MQQNLSESTVVISGHLEGCGSLTAAFYLSFWVPSTLEDRVAFQARVQPDSAATEPMTKIYLTFRSDGDRRGPLRARSSGVLCVIEELISSHLLAGARRLAWGSANH